MKRTIAIILALLLIGCALAEELYTAFGYDFGTELETIRSDMEAYEGVRVGMNAIWTDAEKKAIIPNVRATMPKDGAPVAFGRRVLEIVFIGIRGDETLHKTSVTLDGIEPVRKYNTYEAPDIEAYDASVELWSNIVKEFAAAYGFSDDAAVYYGEGVTEAILTNTDELQDADKLKLLMPSDWYVRHKRCGVVIHCGNVMLELKLIQEKKKIKALNGYSLENEITVTYNDEPYNALVAVTPTPTPEPKKSLDGLNIMG